MALDRRAELRQLFHGLAEVLDITDTQYEAAVGHYKAVGKWLNKEDSPIAQYDPEIFPQGSFRLGTMIKPLNDVDKYDIDLVCEMKKLSKRTVTQRELKDMVGDRLKENERYEKMIEEGKRCWTLKYADSASFHMDILPAIPDHEINGILKQAGADIAATAIEITDKDLHQWLPSNPIGYAEWFKKQMIIQFNEKRIVVARSLKASVEEVPDYKVKTPLQRSIQILKRHRDFRFKNDRDDRPASIIISTLAARAYNNEADLLEALVNIVKNMPSFIEQDTEGRALIRNPVSPPGYKPENFADRWLDHPQRETKFRNWMKQVREDIDSALRSGSYQEMVAELQPRFGDRIVIESESRAFPERHGSKVVAASVAPNIIIKEPSKPWGK